MLTCERCREQMLSFLYDLLEPVERDEMIAHLQSCPACQEARGIAKEQQGLFAEAVKESHPGIVFKAPPVTAIKATPASTAPTMALPPTPRRPFFLNRWSIAATLLFCLVSAGSVLGWGAWAHHADQLAGARNRLAQANNELRKTQADLNLKKVHTQNEIKEIQEQIDKLFKNWGEEENQKRKVLEDQRTQLIITGPQNTVAGAENKFDVAWRSRAGQNLPGKAVNKADPIDAADAVPTNMRVVNQANQETVYQQALIPDMLTNKTRFVLPQDLPLKPGADLAIEFDLQSKDGKTTQLRDNLKVVFPEYVTHVATDRPMYRPGETIRFRSLTLERFSLKPALESFNLRFRILAPNNAEVYKHELASLVTDQDKNPIKGPDGNPLKALGVGEYTIPEHFPAGHYSLIVSEVNDRFREEKRTVIVNRWQAPRLNKELVFQRASYSAGDLVKFTVRAVPVQGLVGGRGLQLNCKVTVDGNSINANSDNPWTDNEGRATFDFQLPPQIFKGVGKVEVVCNDGGNSETIVRAIPIIVRDLQVELFPEGGDLIAGVPNRVYFQVRTPAGKPADVQARLVTDLNQEIARAQTLTDDDEPGINQGLGSFTFTPLANRRYSLRIDSPIGIERTFPLPLVKKTGIVLHAPQGVVEREIPIIIHAADRTRELLIGAYCRGRLLDHTVVLSKPGKPAQATLKLDGSTAGVYRITAFEIKDQGGRNASYQPLAERLVYRKSSERIDVAVTSDKATYQPRDRVNLSLWSKNEKQVSTPTLSTIAVVDASNLKLADEKTARAMPTHFLLTTEIRNPEDLEIADVLLGNHPKAAQALDLLLGSQGWRRFAEQDPLRFRDKQQQARMPNFLANATPVAQLLDSEQKQLEQLDQTFVAKAVDLQKKLAEKETHEDGPIPLRQAVDQHHNIVAQAESEINLAQARLREIRGLLIQFGLGGLLLALLFVGFFLISVGLRRLSEGGHARTWFTAGAGLLVLLFLASIIGTFALMGERFDDFHVNDFNNVGVPKKGGGVWQNAAPVNQPMILPLIIEDVPVKDDIDPEANPAQQQPVPPRPAQDMSKEIIVQQAPPWRFDMDLNQRLIQGFENNDEQLRKMQGQGQDDRFMRQQGNYQQVIQRQLGRRVQFPAANDPGVVREYAHRHAPQPDDVRRDFAETVYWHPVLVLPDGKGQVSFDLADSVTRYQVLVLSNSLDGRMGATRHEIAARLPFHIDPKVPTEVSSTDQITIPVAVNNDQAKKNSITLSARFKGLNLDGNAERGLNLDANEKNRELFKVTPSVNEGTASVRVVSKTAGNSDAVERTFKVVQDGFPMSRSVSGTLENSVDQEITLPDTWIPGSLKVQAHFYPSPLAQLQSGLDELLREPVGCFEQSSSSNYPNVLVLNYMKQTNQANLLAEKRAHGLMRSGYQKLTSFECVDLAQGAAKRGYEWFGGAAPPHEALTAYGLMQFRDMSKVYPVDTDMLQRTEKYLLDQRDGNGGFKRNRASIDSFGRAPDHVTNAYIVWALTEASTTANLDKELAVLYAQCKDRKDPYFLALVGLSHLNRHKLEVGLDLCKRIGELQRPDGNFAGAEMSITGAQGRDLDIETTSLVILAWIKANRNADLNNARAAFTWLGQQRRDQGSFGSTQATVLALKAMLAYAQRNPRQLQNGEVNLTARDGVAREQRNQPAGRPAFRTTDSTIVAVPEVDRAAFTARSLETLTVQLRDAAALRPGKNTIELKVTNNNTIPYTLTWSYRTLKPDNAADAPVKLTTRLAGEQAKENETIKLTALVENVSGKGQGMTVAIVGLPGGLSLPENFEQLKDLERRRDNGKKPGKIDAWELRGRELVLYWRELAPNTKIEIDLDLICRLPGNYRGPASRAYLYYDAERKYWVEPLGIRILAKE